MTLEEAQTEARALMKRAGETDKAIDIGFAAFVLAAGLDPAKMPVGELEAMRNVFFAGAQHLWALWLTTLDPGEEPTEADMTRLDNINAELERWAAPHEAGLAKKLGEQH
jgi:hypothetical protein